jgi:hypothetical protein
MPEVRQHELPPPKWLAVGEVLDLFQERDMAAGHRDFRQRLN